MKDIDNKNIHNCDRIQNNGSCSDKDSKVNNTITATELKSNLGMYLDYVIDNNEVVITKNGKKAVRLSPYITDADR